MDKQQLYNLRNDYSEQGIRRRDLAADPLAQFATWFDQAVAAEIAEPNAMCLSTVDTEGRSWIRTVLMKSCDPQGLVFFTNYTSRKAQQIAHNTAVSALFPWLSLHRQVIFQGVVEKVSEAESKAYFASRPRATQLGTWASRQSQPLTERSQLESRLTEITRRFESQPVPPPHFWGGYRLLPTRVEFWQGRNSRLHDRLVYNKPAPGDAPSWQISRLYP